MFPLQHWNQKSNCQRNYNQKKVKIYLRDTKKKNEPQWTVKIRVPIVSERRTKFVAYFFGFTSCLSTRTAICACVLESAHKHAHHYVACIRVCACVCACVPVFVFASVSVSQNACQSESESESWVLSPESWIIDCPNIVHCFCPPVLISCRWRCKVLVPFYVSVLPHPFRIPSWVPN